MVRHANFSAGPAVLPESVLKKAAKEIDSSQPCLLETSHRDATFVTIHQKAIQSLIQLLNIPDTHTVLFMQGGATGQFAAVVLNLVKPGQKHVDYLVTGQWSSKAAEEAKLLGMDVNVIASTKTGVLPPQNEWKCSENPAFAYYCSNETVDGIELDPIFSYDSSVPIVSDMSSNILTKPVDFSRLALVFAGAQKNIGPAGLTVVIVRKDLLHQPTLFPVPTALNYSIYAKNDSLYHTPCTFAIYMAGLVFEWMIEQGGLLEFEKRSALKSQKLYSIIDQYPNVYHCPVDVSARSRVNVVFRIKNQSHANLEDQFVKEAEGLGLFSLKGHRSVGGIRASLYNALPMEDVDHLAEFMIEFAKKNI